MGDARHFKLQNWWVIQYTDCHDEYRYAYYRMYGGLPLQGLCLCSESHDVFKSLKITDHITEIGNHMAQRM